jgi:hypothetical protein
MSHHSSTSVDAWKQHQTQVTSLIFPAITQRVTQQQKKYIDKLNTTRNIITSSLPPGTLVALKDPHYLLGKSIKPGAEPTYMGSYTIVRRLPTGPYIVKDDTGEQLDRPVPLDQMRVLFPPNHKHNAPAASSSSTDTSTDNANHAVQHIINHRLVDGHSLQYFVKWKGCTGKHNSWVDETDMLGTDIVHRYFQQLQAKKDKQQHTPTAAPTLRHVTIMTRQQRHILRDDTPSLAFTCSQSSPPSPS